MGFMRSAMGYFAADVTHRVVGEGISRYNNRKAMKQGHIAPNQQGYPQQGSLPGRQGVQQSPSYMDNNVIEGTAKEFRWTMPKVRQYFSSVNRLMVLDTDQLSLLRNYNGNLPHCCVDPSTGMWAMVTLPPQVLPNDQEPSFPYFYCSNCGKVVVMPMDRVL